MKIIFNGKTELTVEAEYEDFASLWHAGWRVVWVSRAAILIRNMDEFYEVFILIDALYNLQQMAHKIC